MDSIEKTGRTVDSAIEAALRELGLERDDVEVDVLEIESSGVLGIFGRREGRVRVTPIRRIGPRKSAGGQKVEEKPVERKLAASAPPKKAEKKSSGLQVQSETAVGLREPIPDEKLGSVAKEIVEKIASCFGIDVEVEGTASEDIVNLRVVGDGVGQLIGRRGKTLGAVQYMVSRLLNEDRASKRKVLIDVDGYSEDREQALRELTERNAERVVRTKRPVVLRPMNPQERRLVHMTLQGDEELATESFGDEGSRRVVVYPRSMDEAELRRFMANDDSGSGHRPHQRGRRRGGAHRRP